jgi:hypothetical protein
MILIQQTINFELSALNIRYIVASRIHCIDVDNCSKKDIEQLITDHLTLYGVSGIKNKYVELPGFVEGYLTELYPDIFPVFEHVISEHIMLDDGYEYEVVNVQHTFISLLRNKTGQIICMSYQDLEDHKI